MTKQIQIFEASKMTLAEAMAETIASLNEYGSRFPHWVFTFSGGKDSTVTVSFAAWAIRSGLVKRPKSLRVLNSDTGIELIPLHLGARQFLSELENDGFIFQIVKPELDNRVFVAILGRGLPPFNNGRRTCTRLLKADPMTKAVAKLATEQDVTETLFISGVRLGESRSRDERIAVSCSTDSGECGQGWFQNQFNDWGYASLSPIVHWRVCNVFDWLYFEQDKHGYSIDGVLEVYGDEDLRTGCMACFAVEQDRPLIKVSKTAKWAHLGILLELYDVYEWLNRPENRLRKPLTFNKDGSICQKSGFIGPLTMEARRIGLEWVLDIQRRAGVVLIDDEELTRIYWHWENNTWPKGWTGDEPRADVLLPRVRVITQTRTVNGKKSKSAIGYATQKNLLAE